MSSRYWSVQTSGADSKCLLPRVQDSSPTGVAPTGPHGVRASKSIAFTLLSNAIPGMGTDRAVTDPLRRAAFGDTPSAGAARLLAGGEPTPVRRWLAAVVLGGHGRYAAATGLLTGLLGAADPVLGSLAASTLAAHRRQLGGHVVARSLDAIALRRVAGLPIAAIPDPDGTDVTGALADALLGLAADAIGLGRPAEAGRLLRRVDGLGELGWRSRVRSGWVNVEALLATGEPERAVPIAERCVAESASCGAVRHVTKSEMMLAVACMNSATERGRARAIGLLEGVACRSLEREFLPLAWPSALLLADACPSAANSWREQGRCLALRLLSSTDPEGARIATGSLWFPNSLLQTGEATATEEADNFLTD